MSVRRNILVIGATSLLLAGCGGMVNTRVTEAVPANVEVDCGRAGGKAYHLPRRKIKYSVRRYAKSTPVRHQLEIHDELINSTDNRWNFCLTPVASAFSKDEIGFRAPEGLLTRVFTKADDQTVAVAENVVEAVARGIVQSALPPELGRFEPGREEDDGVFLFGPWEYDPFDRYGMSILNQELKEFGYCIHLDASNDPFVPAWAPEQCGGVAEFLPVRSAMQELQNQPVLPPEPWGVLYRPLITHRLLVLKRPDPTTETPWTIEQSKILRLPNAAPAMEIEIDRAIFAERKTQLYFDAGVLTNVKIEKGSELNEFFSFPITLAQIIVSIPAEILKLRIGITTDQTELLKANQALIDSVVELKKAQALEEQARRDALTKYIVDNPNKLARTDQIALYCSEEAKLSAWTEQEEAGCQEYLNSCGGELQECMNAFRNGFP